MRDLRRFLRRGKVCGGRFHFLLVSPQAIWEGKSFVLFESRHLPLSMLPSAPLPNAVSQFSKYLRTGTSASKSVPKLKFEASTSASS